MTLLCDTIMMDTYHYTLVQANWMDNTKSDPNVAMTLSDDDVSMQFHHLLTNIPSGGEC